MFQYIILYISSDVILFHRRWEKAGRENGKINGENMEKAPDQRAEEKKKVRMAARKQEKTAENHMGDTKPAKEKLYYAELGASEALVPRLRRLLMGQEEDLVWKTPDGVPLWDIIMRQNISRRIFLLTLYYAS